MMRKKGKVVVMIGLWTFKAKENKRVRKTAAFFEKIDKNAKCYCPEGFHSAN